MRKKHFLGYFLLNIRPCQPVVFTKSFIRQRFPPFFIFCPFFAFAFSGRRKNGKEIPGLRRQTGDLQTTACFFELFFRFGIEFFPRIRKQLKIFQKPFHFLVRIGNHLIKTAAIRKDERTFRHFDVGYHNPPVFLMHPEFNQKSRRRPCRGNLYWCAPAHIPRRAQHRKSQNPDCRQN